MDRPQVGSSLPRVDGVAKVTGRARYLDDLDAPEAWHGATVRSNVARGVLEGFDLDPAFDWSRVVVATAGDVPGRNVIALIEDDQPALVPIGGNVMHHDEAIALVAAPTRALAFAAMRAIKPKIRALPAIFTVEDSLAKKELLYGADNVFKQFLIRKGHTSDADFEAAVAGAAHVIDGTYYTSPQEQMYIEPQAMMAEWHDGTCYVVGSMQCPYYVHKAMKALLGCDGDGVVITQSVTGGGFGGKEEYPSMLAAHVAILAKRAGRAVKMTYDRDEDIAATTKRHPAFTRHRLAVDAARRARRDRRRLRDGRRRLPHAVAGRAVARRVARGGALSLPDRARARPRRRDEPSTSRRVSRVRRAADDVSVRAPDPEARAAAPAKIRSRSASGSRCAAATPRRPASCSGFRSAPTRCSARSSTRQQRHSGVDRSREARSWLRVLLSRRRLHRLGRAAARRQCTRRGVA